MTAVPKEVATELTTQLQLSLIYKRLLDELFTLAFCRGPYEVFRGERHQSALTTISQAFSEAVGLLSQRCPKCDSPDTIVICSHCNDSKELFG